LSEVIESIAGMGARAHAHMYTGRLQGEDDHLAEDIDNLRTGKVCGDLPEPVVKMLLHAGIAGI